MEVSQLLRLYQARGWGALSAEDLLLYLKKLEHSRYQPGGETRRGGVCMSVCRPLNTLLSFSGEENEGKM